MTPITPFEEAVDHTPLTGVPWWRQRLFENSGWRYRIVDVADLSSDDQVPLWD